MKLIVSSLTIALAASAVSAAPPPPVEPAPTAVQQPAIDQPPSPEKLALARRFISAAISADQFMKAVRMQATAGFEASERDAADDADASDKAEAQKYLERYIALLDVKFRERLPRLFDAYAFAYAREYSEEELQQMVAFAQSPVGKHYLSSRMDVEMDPLVQAEQRGFGNDVEPVVEQLRKEMCQERTAKRIAAGDKKAKCPLSEPDSAQG